MDAKANPAPESASRGPSAGPPAAARPQGRGKPTGNVGPGSAAYPESVTRLIDELARLPGIGRRSAERLAFHILKSTEPAAMALARAIADVKQRVRHCTVCYNLLDSHAAADAPSSGARLCSVCADPSRNRTAIMVVEQPKDLIALELTGAYKGLYHVLMGRISPLEGVTAGDLTVADLLHRVDDPAANLDTRPQEIVLALNPTLEGDGTALYLSAELERRGVSVTRLARGLPTGSTLEFASKAVLADAIQGRKPMN